MDRGVQHFVITRLGLCVYDEPTLSDILDLFQTVTMCSLLNQTDPRFTCLVVIDADMPEASRARLERMLAPHVCFEIVSIDVTKLIQVRQGCFDWVWEACQNHLLVRRAVKSPDEYVVTSILDADDAWHRDVVSTVNRAMSQRLEQLLTAGGDRGSWLQHTRGIAATFTSGYTWFIEGDTWLKVNEPFMSMAVFVIARFSSGISACSSRHLGWPAYCKVLAFESLAIPQKEPMWIWVRHARTTQPWAERRPSIFDGLTRFKRCALFGLEPERVAAWRDQHRSHEGQDPRRSHPGVSASDQLDRVFQIAGLNRQIAALIAARELGADNPSEGGGTEAVVAEARAKREALVALLRSHGRDLDEDRRAFVASEEL